MHWTVLAAERRATQKRCKVADVQITITPTCRRIWLRGKELNSRAKECDANLTVDPCFQDFVENELLPGLGIEAAKFWRDFATLIADLTPENVALLSVRDDLQERIDTWHRNNGDFNSADYRSFLGAIGYLEDAVEPFQIQTQNVDPEIATIAGPQLVVPVNNARFALNAANARWGSLYDALYGTDVIPESDGCQRSGPYNPNRGAKVVDYAVAFLDQTLPLKGASYGDVKRFDLNKSTSRVSLDIALKNGTTTALADTSQFVGYAIQDYRRRLLLQNNGLHIEILLDPMHPVGKVSPAGVADVQLESAITAIQDCEDSVAAVDAIDKVGVYRNWLGLMRGNLSAKFQKNERELTRTLNADRDYKDLNGAPLTLPGRSLLLVRNVGHLMTNNAVLDASGHEVFEGILDAVVTTACALYDLRGHSDRSNSRSGSIYIVKPKMHGSKEVAFANRLFAAVEDLFGLDRFTLKIGVMDEERRTSVNLEQCIYAVKERLVFINTGFLDRTGDEIHTSMEAGPMLTKEQIKAQPWISAYEDRNVDIGLRCGLPGKAQIGKGMWPKPDEMQQMVETKQAHPEAGANCAWVPSPTAATLHAMHYHHVNVADVQRRLASRTEANLADILTPPLAGSLVPTPDEVQKELDNNAQGILGYVVRWIDQGVGCSKVPDINNVGLMEDRATCRISSQHIANWLHHDICSEEQVRETFTRMAAIVDQQNADDPAYETMAPDFDGIAFKAACDLAIIGAQQPSGYTEPLLHEYRAKKKL